MKKTVLCISFVAALAVFILFAGATRQSAQSGYTTTSTRGRCALSGGG